MYERILVPLDGSELADRALPYVEWLAGRLDSEVVLLNACVQGEPSEHLLRTHIEKRAEELRSSGIKANSLVVQGYCATEIINFAEKNDIGLIIISTHGRTGITRWALGNIASKVAQKSGIPVLLLRSSQLEAGLTENELWKILVPLDGSKVAEAVIPYVEDLAERMDSEVILLRVVEPIRLPSLYSYSDREKHQMELISMAEEEAERYLSKMESTLGIKGVKISSALLRERPTESIIQYAEDNSVSLIAIGTHGFSGIAKWAYGSVASRLIEGSPKPLLLVRPPLPKPNT
jgi:nucleotide-binding universal stress UspA family protein